MLSFIIYLSLITNIFAQTCYNATSCKGLKIYDNATCYGFESCAVSRIQTSGYVECLGGEGCIDSRYILANGLITCSGFESCYRTRDIKSFNSSILCIGDTSCAQSTITAPSGNVLCSGYASCKNSNVNAKRITCLGQKSCQQMYHVGVITVANCDGDQACAFATIVGESIDCRSQLSCEKTNLMISGAVYGYGHKSLYNANNINAKSIDAFGYKSMEKAFIDSANIKNEEIVINIFGLQAGFKAIINCRNSSICTVNCKGDGCDGVAFNCLYGAQCNISPRDCMTSFVAGGISSEFISCPTFILSTSKEADEVILNDVWTNKRRIETDDDNDKQMDKYEQLILETADKESLAIEMEIEHDVDVASYAEDSECEDFHWDECDDVLECAGRNFTAADTDCICLGYESCLNVDINFDDDIQCYGYKSCMNASRIYTSGSRTEQRGIGRGTGKGYIRCSSTKSCYAAGYISAKEAVSCLGKLACATAGYIESRQMNVKCDGTCACEDTQIIAAKKIDCVSFRSCGNSTLESKVIACNGPESCNGAEIISPNAVKCDGSKSCGDAIINARIYKAYSYFDSINSKIVADNVYGYGYGSLGFSHIDSGSLKTVRVFSYGYMSGYGATVTCQSGSTCRISCEFSGCQDLHFMCYLGSTCNVFPKECNPTDQVNITVNGTSCPRWIYQKSDHDLDELIQERELNKKYDSIYQHVMNKKSMNSVDFDEFDDLEHFEHFEVYKQEKRQNVQYEFELIKNIKIETDDIKFKDEVEDKQFYGKMIVILVTGIVFAAALILFYRKCLKIKTKDLNPEIRPLLLV